MSPSSPAVPPDDAALRAVIVAAGRRLGARGLIAAGEGNISVRRDDATILITPSGRRKDELSPDDLVVLGGDTATAEADRGRSGSGLRASSDRAIHEAIYASRPEVTAVAHAHLPAAMALTLAGEVPDPAALPETALLLPRLPYLTFGAPGSDELARRVAEALAGGPMPLPGAVLLERHGAVAVGSGDPHAAIVQALDRLELVEVLCRTWREALLIAAARGRGAEASILRPPSPSPWAPARGRSRRKP